MKLPSIKSASFFAGACAVLFLALYTVVAANPVDNEKTRNRAQRALRAGDFERAEQIYRELLAKDDQDADARLGLSHALLTSTG